MNRTRILHLMQCTYLGGTEQTMYALMRGLHGHEYEFRVLSMHPPGDGATLMAAAGIRTTGHAYRGRFGWRSHLGLRRSIARTPCDLVLVTGPTLSGCLAVPASQSRRRVLTVHYHHGDDPAARHRWRAFYRLCGHHYRIITYLTDFIRAEAVSIAPWIAPRARTVRAPVVAIGRTDDATRRHAKRRLVLDPDAPLIGNASRFDGCKRLDVFLRTARLVADRRPDARFILAGDGPYRAALERLAADLGLADRVHFTGWLREPATLFQALDVLLFNSDADAFGRTPAEAMATGVPVVASVLYGGTNELIDHGANGVLLTRHDEPALADHVLELLDDAALRDARVDAALQTVHDKHGYEAFLQAYRGIFEEAMSV